MSLLVSIRMSGQILLMAIARALCYHRRNCHKANDPNGVHHTKYWHNMVRNPWMRILVENRKWNPLADPRIIYFIAEILGVYEKGIPNPIISRAERVYSKWTRWMATTKRAIEDYQSADPAATLKGTKTEVFFETYLSKGQPKTRVSAWGLLKGRMRGVIRRRLDANPYKSEIGLLQELIEDTELSHAERGVLHGCTTDIGTALREIFRKSDWKFEDLHRYWDMHEHVYAKHVRFWISDRWPDIMRQVRLIQLWYFMAKGSSKYTNRISAMESFKPCLADIDS